MARVPGVGPGGGRGAAGGLGVQPGALPGPEDAADHQPDEAPVHGAARQHRLRPQQRHGAGPGPGRPGPRRRGRSGHGDRARDQHQQRQQPRGGLRPLRRALPQHREGVHTRGQVQADCGRRHVQAARPRGSEVQDPRGRICPHPPQLGHRGRGLLQDPVPGVSREDQDQPRVRAGAEHGADVPHDPVRRHRGGGHHAARPVRAQPRGWLDQVCLPDPHHCGVIEGIVFSVASI